jgi:hypothetical protein
MAYLEGWQTILPLNSVTSYSLLLWAAKADVKR